MPIKRALSEPSNSDLGQPTPSAALPIHLTMTSAKMSPAYSRSPCSPSALSASSSPGGAHRPGGLSGGAGEALVPAGTLSGSGSRAAAGLCKGGLGSAPGAPAGRGTQAPIAHQHLLGWRGGRNQEPSFSCWSEEL